MCAPGRGHPAGRGPGATRRRAAGRWPADQTIETRARSLSRTHGSEARLLARLIPAGCERRGAHQGGPPRGAGERAAAAVHPPEPLLHRRKQLEEEQPHEQRADPLPKPDGPEAAGDEGDGGPEDRKSPRLENLQERGAEVGGGVAVVQSLVKWAMGFAAQRSASACGRRKSGREGRRWRPAQRRLRAPEGGTRLKGRRVASACALCRAEPRGRGLRERRGGAGAAWASGRRLGALRGQAIHVGAGAARSSGSGR